MKNKGFISTIIASFWTVFTTALVSWWILYILNSDHTDIVDHRRMLVWEGSFLLVAVIFGGISLVFFTVKDQEHLKKLKIFFTIFSHDLKTSIARLRIQAEVLQEMNEVAEVENPAIGRIVQDIDRLNLKLENALWVARGEEINLVIEKNKLSGIVGFLKSEFPELNIKIVRDAELHSDKRLMASVLRNIFHNSIHHGRASEIKISCIKEGQNRIRVEIQDNGVGMSDPGELGLAMLSPREGKTNGIGLYFTKKIIERQNGAIEFASINGSGFSVTLILNGALL